jgi:hypothetical protein
VTSAKLTNKGGVPGKVNGTSKVSELDASTAPALVVGLMPARRAFIFYFHLISKVQLL